MNLNLRQRQIKEAQMKLSEFITILLEQSELITIIVSIISAVLASWGGVYFNNRHQFKAQKENHERRIKTEIFTKTINALSENRELLAHLSVLSTEKTCHSIQQNKIPPEFYLWASDETIRAVLDLCTAIIEETSRLTTLKTDIDAKKEVLNIIIENRHSDELRIEKENEIHTLTEELISECKVFYTQSEFAEIKIIACIRREYGTSFNEERFREMANAHNNQCLETMRKYNVITNKIHGRMIDDKKKYSRHISNNQQDGNDA